MHLDQRIYNTPSILEVAVIWVENNELEDNFAQNKIERNIIVDSSHSGQS